MLLLKTFLSDSDQRFSQNFKIFKLNFNLNVPCNINSQHGSRFPSSGVNSTDRREEVRTEQGPNQKVFVAREEWQQQDTAMLNEFLHHRDFESNKD